jgi:hypothetical protein
MVFCGTCSLFVIEDPWAFKADTVKIHIDYPHRGVIGGLLKAFARL